MKRYFKVVLYFTLAALLILSQLVPVSGLFSNSRIYAAGTTYYVAKNGSNSNPGTEAKPWLTISKAASTMVAGDTVYVRGGTYKENITITQSGSAGNWITFRAYPGETPIIDCSGMDMNGKAAIRATSQDYIKIDGFEIRNVYPHGALGSAPYNINNTALGIYFSQDSSYIKVYNCYIHHIYGCGIQIEDSEDTYIHNVEIYNNKVAYTNYNGNREPISVRLYDFEIHKNYVHDVQGQNSTVRVQKEGINLKASMNGSVHHNIVDDAIVGIYWLGRGNGSGANADIYSNIVRNCTDGITIASESTTPCEDYDIYNNIVYSCVNGIRLRYAEWNCAMININVVNNTVYDCYRAIYFTGTTYTNCVARNNIFYATKDTSQYWDGIHGVYFSGTSGVKIDHNLFYNSGGKFSSKNKLGEYAVTTNPVLANVTNRDFHLTANSPAINKGSSTLAPTVDFDGVTRSSPPDIGAYEIGGSGSVNQAPVLSSIGSKTIDEGQTLSFSISATDLDGGNLTYSASNLPSGATFSAATGTFSWTPTNTQAGTYTGVSFRVSDGTLTDSENITIAVGVVDTSTPESDVNTLTSQNPVSGYKLTIDIFGQGQVTANHSGTWVKISATPEPGWTFSQWNGVTSTTSPQVWVDMTGDRTIAATFIYSSSGTSTESDANQTPVLNSVGSKTIDEEQTLSFTLSATDPDGSNLTYSASNLPSGATFDADTGTFSWTPTDTQAGTYTGVSFQVSDGTLTDSENIIIAVGIVDTSTPESDVNTFTSQNPISGYKLTIEITGRGQVTANHSGTWVKISATPDSGWTFSRWTGVTSITSPQVWVDMSRNRTITATFIN